MISETLTYAERLCLALIAEGMAVDDIVTRLKIPHKDILEVLKSARRKLRAETVLAAVAKALRQGLIAV